MTFREDRVRIQKEALKKIKMLTGNSDRWFVQVEIPGISKSTLNALVRKGCLQESRSDFGEIGPMYYSWTEKELE
jgi:hypothetical protein